MKIKPPATEKASVGRKFVTIDHCWTFKRWCEETFRLIYTVLMIREIFNLSVLTFNFRLEIKRVSSHEVYGQFLKTVEISILTRQAKLLVISIEHSNSGRWTEK